MHPLSIFLFKLAFAWHGFGDDCSEEMTPLLPVELPTSKTSSAQLQASALQAISDRIRAAQ